ncbi:MAG: hypothetical protein DRO99_02440, partial [Candidatus Aenigmatarchaeota archaeon]
GSDAHTLGMVGVGAISAKAGSVSALLKAIKAGKVTMSRRYVLLSEMKEWNRQRMINEYMHVVRYIDKKFGRAGAWAMKGLMRKFMFSDSVVWDMLARATVLGSVVYGSIKIFSYC